MKTCMMSSTLTGSPEEIVAAAVECKMSAVDWITSAEVVDAAYLGRITRDAGLDVAAYTPVKCGEMLSLDEFKRLTADAVKMSAPVMMIPPFGLPDQVSREEDRKRWTEWFSRALPIAQDAGIVLTLEATGMLDSPITTAGEVLEVLQAVPGLKLTHDFGNMVTAGTTVEECRQLYSYIVHMHMKDWIFYDENLPGTYPVRCGKFFKHAVIGEGDMDWRSIWNDFDDRIRKLYVNLEIFLPYSDAPRIPILKRVSESLLNW
ncbi:MAG: sugar phosphate isomerase/epimerase [Lentisphaerae bacterium]|nr:sugar phosphate isomerase/epimerase [Lentisphaerota bacterium]